VAVRERDQKMILKKLKGCEGGPSQKSSRGKPPSANTVRSWGGEHTGHQTGDTYNGKGRANVGKKQEKSCEKKKTGACYNISSSEDIQTRFGPQMKGATLSESQKTQTDGGGNRVKRVGAWTPELGGRTSRIGVPQVFSSGHSLKKGRGNGKRVVLQGKKEKKKKKERH